MNKPFTLLTARRALLISAVALAAGCSQEAAAPAAAPAPAAVTALPGRRRVASAP